IGFAWIEPHSGKKRQGSSKGVTEEGDTRVFIYRRYPILELLTVLIIAYLHKMEGIH
ncbi:unnamed protein product, partial [Callosobruchus maculatus]